MNVEGMILAAGRGTRLGALGSASPKALIEVGGRTMIERTVEALVAAGVRRVVVNVHHHAKAITRFLAAHDLGAEIVVRLEEREPLETGGGMLHARALLGRDGPLLVHNVDVICTADLAALVREHAHAGALATLAVQERETRRQLLFDDAGLLGREDRGSGARREVRAPRGDVRAFAFAGIHACDPRLLDLFTERGVFPIVDAWLRLAGEGHAIRPWAVPQGAWFEVGNPDRLAAARARFAS